MKQFGYYFFKGWVAVGLFFYYRKINVIGLENASKDKPVLFLSNHQNALLDILLIATRCNRKPWYLTRSDVFKNKLFSPLFAFLQMLPIYRIRDGRASLSKNQAIFDRCSRLLAEEEAILLFPEGNHSLRRRVRPLSKGFVRILENGLEKAPDLDIQLVPIGQNYQSPMELGDSAALYFGKPIAVQDFIKESNFIERLKQEVFESLTQLTTHIEMEDEYETLISKFEAKTTNFLFPKKINRAISTNDFSILPKTKSNALTKLFRALFYVLNLPMVLLWRVSLKPKVPEAEFRATFRFGFALICYPFFYALILVLFSTFFELKTACIFVVVHAVLNLLLVKSGITSSHQRK